MITPEVMAKLKAKAQEHGDELLNALTERETHLYFDLALFTYMFHAHCTASLRNALANTEQVADMMRVIEEISAFARAEAESMMQEIGVLRQSDG